MSKFQFMYASGISFTDNVRQECGRLLQVAKRNLENHGELEPMAFIVQPGGSIDLMTLNLDTGQRKAASFGLVYTAAKAVKATVVIVIADAWMRAHKVTSVESVSALKERVLKDYRPGDLSRDPLRKEVLWMYAYGQFGCWGTLSFYHRSGKVIIWDGEQSSDKPGALIQQNMLRAWWDEGQQTKVV